MRDYTDIDPSTLTVEDAQADELFRKTQRDYFEFVALDASILESVAFDLTIDEAGEAFMAIADYAINGTEPEYSAFSSTAVKGMVRTAVKAHKRRMDSEFLRHYRQFVAAQAKRQAKENKGT